MREKKQVVRELNGALTRMKELTAQEGASAEDIRTATAEVERLTDELNQINVAEAAERAAAQAQAESWAKRI